MTYGSYLSHILEKPSISMKKPSFSIKKPGILIEKPSFFDVKLGFGSKNQVFQIEKPSLSIPILYIIPIILTEKLGLSIKHPVITRLCIQR